MSEAVRAHRSIAIVGGGIIGLSIAWRLAQARRSVTLYEKAQIGREASWAGAGMLSPGGEIEAESPLAALAIESRRLYPAFVSELQGTSGLAIDYQECGGLDLAYSAGEMDALEHRAKGQLELGIESKPITDAEVCRLLPTVRKAKLAGGRFYPGDAIVNPREAIRALAAACGKSQVSILENCAVSRATIGPDFVKLETHRGSQTHAAAVIAAGAWSDSISVEGANPVPRVEPAKGHLIGYQQAQHLSKPIIRYGHMYLLERATGFLIAGASIERVGFNREIDQDVAASLAHRAGFIFPHLNGIAPSETWIGFRPASDGLHIGPWESRTLYLAYGHYRNGILLAPATAERVAAQISANLGTC